MFLSRLSLLMCVCLTALTTHAAESIPDKTVVLTFDDSVQSHRDFVGPLLKEYGFGATFFVTHLWMDDEANFMTWEDIGELHEMGFEIGNHSWTHAGFASPYNASRLAGELALVDNELKKVGVPKPVSFAWCGNQFGPESKAVLAAHGIQFARRGMQPEIPYGKIELGPLYEAQKHDPLLIPTSGDGYPEWDLPHFKKVVDRAKDGKIAIVQFHGVPDTAHPWVHTPPERFKEYMAYLKAEGFNVIALKDVARYREPNDGNNDPVAKLRYPAKVDTELKLPTEVVQTRENEKSWYQNMFVTHRYSREEIKHVFGFNKEEWSTFMHKRSSSSGILKIDPLAPYPGGRHPRIGFFEGMIDPQRGTKVSLFTPWEDHSYVVFDLPEAIFSNLGLTFLAHTHIPTIWDDQDMVIDNVDWTQNEDGSLTFTRELPNGIRFGSTAKLVNGGVDATMWLENGTEEPLTNLRTQVCAMLGAVPGFKAQTNDNKTMGISVATATSTTHPNRHILVAFDHCGRTWGNKSCPCIHADPVFPDAAPGERVEVNGRLWFYEGTDLAGEIAQAEALFKTPETK
jgi:peptidoglycan/xylan/chitin deacetylase (PgdA/CDA1 family)